MPTLKDDLAREARAELVAIEIEISDLETKIADARARADKRRNFLEMLEHYSAHGVNEVPIPAQEPEEQRARSNVDIAVRHVAEAPLAALSKDSPFYGISLAEAACVVLKAKAEPLTAAAIVRELRAGGWMFTAKNPTVTLYWAMRERALKLGDVIATPGNTWSLSVWRPDDDRLRAARAGLAAARTRGARLGPPIRFTDELKTQVDSLLAEGKKVPTIARVIGISAPAIYKWLHTRDQQKPDLIEAAVHGLNRPH
jgi:hypothetical protein